MDLGPSPSFFGYADFSGHKKWDDLFLAVPNATLAGEELQKLTSEPHWASSPEDYRTALYVASKFKDAGLQTQIVPFRVYLNKPVKIQIDAFDSAGRKLMSGPTPEHVDPKAYGGDPSQDDPRILPAFNGSSPSGDVTAQVVYANYGTVEDFKLLDKLGISVKGKIVIMRYGQIFRGVKVELASSTAPPAFLSTPTPPTTATSVATSTRAARIAPPLPCSAAPCSSCPSIPAIRRPPASPPRPTCRTPAASRTARR
jgi:N-acetylated-alpha-linked acidic dipeptidase